MSSLIEAYLNGSKRVTARIYYFIPLQEGQDPLKIQPKIIGAKPVEVHHTNLLQEYLYQVDDKSDLEDNRLAAVFSELVMVNNGIVKIQDRSARISAMDPVVTTDTKDMQHIAPLLIPSKAEQTNPGMADVAAAFKAMVPFPRVRQFLQFWQEKIDGPLHHVQIAFAEIPQSHTDHRSANFLLN